MNSSSGNVLTFSVIVAGIVAIVMMAAPDTRLQSGNAFIDKAANSSVMDRVISALN